MKLFSKSLCLAALLAGLASCSNDDNPWRGSTTEGGLQVDITTDSRVLMSTRADDTRVSVVPDASQFSISFEKNDGTYSKTWPNVTSFNKEMSFPIGTYTLSATYGNPDHEGFELPCFGATEEVMIESGIESHVNLTATLTNSMVSVRYTDEFKSSFTAYSAALKGASSSEYVVFAQNEDRPAYMKPEKQTLRLTLTNTQGQQVTVSPYVFTALPQYHYIVTMGIKNSQGNGELGLDIQITEEVESEFVDISLGDDLFTAPKPSLKAVDFPTTMTYNDFEAFEASGDPRFDVLAYGGLRKVNLNVTTANPLIFGNSVQLVGADALTQSNIATTGLVAEGFYRNPGKAGVIKFKDFFSKLPVGTYKVSVDVEDVRTLVCDQPLEFTVTIIPVTIQLAIAEHPEYMGEEMTVSVTANKADVRNSIRFQVTDANEQWTDAQILTDPVSVRTRAAGEFNFSYRISTPPMEHYDVKVRAFYGSDSSPRCEITEEGVVFPKYSVEVDALAKRALIKIVPEDESKKEIIFNNFKFLLDGNERGLTEVGEGIYELSGLTPATSYNAFETFLSYADNPHVMGSAFTTESMTDLTNGGFDSSTETLKFDNIQIGGQYRVSPTNYTLTSSIARSTPDGWATVNDLTCWSGSSNHNTWFMVPSTYVEDGMTVIQSVGYSHNGTTPSRSGGAFNTTYYCENAPSDGELSKASGELFLGSYSYDGTAHRTDGIAWTSRPESITFNYTYAPYKGESGEVSVYVYDASGEEIASGSDWILLGQGETMTLPIRGYSFGKKAAKLAVCFRSTRSGMTPAIYIPTGSELDEGRGLGNHTQPANTYKAVALGSKLKIDNVRLGYEPIPVEQSELRSSRKDSTKRNKAKFHK